MGIVIVLPQFLFLFVLNGVILITTSFIALCVDVEGGWGGVLYRVKHFMFILCV